MSSWRMLFTDENSENAGPLADEYQGGMLACHRPGAYASQVKPGRMQLFEILSNPKSRRLPSAADADGVAGSGQTPSAGR
jgi:hypothetical protein